MSISLEEVRHIAALARLGIDDERARIVAVELSSILEHMEVLRRVDARDAKETGALAQLPGLAGCIAENGDGVTCAVGAGLREAVFVTMSPDGTNLYVASQLSNAVATFARNTLTGGLTQLPGVAGCVSEDGSDDGMALVCADGNGLLGALTVTVSPDGLNAYVASYISNALTVFTRE